MKKLIIIIFCIILENSANAQLNIGDPGAIKTTSFKKKDFEEFKNSTTCFVIRERDKEHLADIEKMLAEVWKFNKYEIIDFDKYVTYSNKPGKMFFGLRSYNRNSEYVKSADLFGKYTQFTDLFIELWVNGTEAKPNNIDEHVLATYELYCPKDIVDEVKQIQTLNAFEFICKSNVEVPFWNWGLLKNDLQVINACLVNNKPLWKFENNVKKDEIGRLSSSKLFVLDKNIRLDSRNQEDVFEKYPYKYEKISLDQLNSKILESSTPFYYLVIDFQGSDKVLSVHNSKSGEIIYSKYKGMSYFVKGKDFEALADEIK